MKQKISYSAKALAESLRNWKLTATFGVMQIFIIFYYLVVMKDDELFKNT